MTGAMNETISALKDGLLVHLLCITNKISMQVSKVLLFLITFISLTCHRKISENTIYQSNNLLITQVSKHTYIHTTYLATETFGRVPCNGMIVIDNNEALIIDTPTDDEVSKELMDWIQQRGATINGVVVTHFHEDCLGGLDAFHQANIPSYANQMTIDLAQEKQIQIPQKSIKDSLVLSIGQQQVVSRFFGAGHTKDNMVCFVPQEKVLFGGCLLKSLNAGKGNLADADTLAWSNTVLEIKNAYSPTVLQTIIPGHGRHGGRALLDFTIELFDR